MKAYRYITNRTASLDEWGDVAFFSFMRLYLEEYEVVKTTPKGFWVQIIGSSQRFVRSTAKNAFCRLDKQAAIIDFTKRKERQINILETQLACAKESLSLGKNELQRQADATH